MQENQIQDQIIENATEIAPKKGFKNLSKREKTLLVLIQIVLSLLILLFIASRIKRGEGDSQQTQEIIPTPTPIVEKQIIAESVYATDSAVIKLEQDIKNTKENLEGIDTNQTDLALPSLDMQISLEN